MYPKQIPGETNRTFFERMRADIRHDEELKNMLESHLRLLLGKHVEFDLFYQALKEGIEKKKKELERRIKEDTCMFCGDLTIIWFEPSYNGYMGRCDTCNSNWRES